MEKDEDKIPKVPRVSMDYFFMSRKDEEAKSNPAIVMVDEDRRAQYARAVGQKALWERGDIDELKIAELLRTRNSKARHKKTRVAPWIFYESALGMPP